MFDSMQHRYDIFGRWTDHICSVCLEHCFCTVGYVSDLMLCCTAFVPVRLCSKIQCKFNILACIVFGIPYLGAYVYILKSYEDACKRVCMCGCERYRERKVNQRGKYRQTDRE